MRDLPVYSIVIDEDSDVDFVALVDRPAIQKDFMAFTEQKEMKFEILSEDKHLLAGPLMLADLPIYRNFDGEECYVTFSKDTIEKIALRFFKRGYQSNVNLMHDDDLQVSGVTMFHSWIYDEQLGTKPLRGYDDAKEGSWFGVFKVENKDVWDLVKQGKVKGFSIEGTMGIKRRFSDEEILNKIKSILCEGAD
jgi:hypothetical protein